MKQPTGFWSQLTRPIYTLAPMADVTDAAFRRIIARHGKPGVLFTEFVSCDGLCSPGQTNLLKCLKYDESERPIVAQVFGKNPETFYHTARLVSQLGFDGIDINMGCPDRNVLKQGAGANLIDQPELAKKIIAETKRGAGDLPVSIKTRIGTGKIVIREWISHLLEAQPVAITVHLRTAREMSKVAAHWDQMHHAVELAENTNTLILGNGDVWNLRQADDLVKQTNVDGIMFGRAILGNPWLFNRDVVYADIAIEQKFATMIEHAELYEKVFGDEKRFVIMRKHLWAYVTGFNGAKELRVMLEDTENAADVRAVLDKFRSAHAHLF